MTGVLVIEDDDRIRLSLVLALEDEGYDVTGAANAEEGLVAQRTQPADFVLIDLMLPGTTAAHRGGLPSAARAGLRSRR